jgi:hypothetical protein
LTLFPVGDWRAALSKRELFKSSLQFCTLPFQFTSAQNSKTSNTGRKLKRKTGVELTGFPFPNHIYELLDLEFGNGTCTNIMKSMIFGERRLLVPQSLMLRCVLCHLAKIMPIRDISWIILSLLSLLSSLNYYPSLLPADDALSAPSLEVFNTSVVSSINTVSEIRFTVIEDVFVVDALHVQIDGRRWITFSQFLSEQASAVIIDGSKSLIAPMSSFWNILRHSLFTVTVSSDASHQFSRKLDPRLKCSRNIHVVFGTDAPHIPLDGRRLVSFREFLSEQAIVSSAVIIDGANSIISSIASFWTDLERRFFIVANSFDASYEFSLKFDPRSQCSRNIFISFNPCAQSVWDTGVDGEPDDFLTMDTCGLRSSSGKWFLLFTIVSALGRINLSFLNPTVKIIRRWLGQFKNSFNLWWYKVKFASVFLKCSCMPNFTRYTLMERLGTGAYGEVYLAWDSLARRQVAVKKYRHKGKFSEVFNLAQVQSEYVIRLMDAFVEGDFLFLVMPKCDEIPESFGFSELIEIARRCLMALQVLSSRSMIHLDLKNANLLVQPGVGVVIADFGIATKMDAEGFAYNANGTEGFKSPEVIRAMEDGKPYYGRTSDVFSLGQTLEELSGSCVDEDGVNIYASEKINLEQWDDLLNLMMTENERERPTPQDLLEHSIFEGLLPSLCPDNN